MSGRLEELGARLGTLRQLEGVMGAMRGIAATRAADARVRVAGMAGYTDTVVGALGEVLALLPTGATDRPLDGSGPTIAAGGRAEGAGPGAFVIAVCAELGLVGGFNEAVVERAAAELQRTPHARLAVVGRRGADAALVRGLRVDDALSMASRADEVPRVARDVLSCLSDAVAVEGRDSAILLHPRADDAAHVTIACRTLVPFDTSAVERAGSAMPPLVTEPPAELVTRLVDEYLYAVLCDALLQSHAAENVARMQSMTRAHHNIEKQLEQGEAEQRRLRQEAITAETAELASGRLARRR